MGSTRELHFLFSVLFPICLYLATVITHLAVHSSYSTSAVMSHSQTELLALQYYVTTPVPVSATLSRSRFVIQAQHMNKVQ